MRNAHLFLPLTLLGNLLLGQCPPSSAVLAPLVEDFTSQTVPLIGNAAGVNLSSCWTLFSGSSSASFRWETEDASGSDENSFATGPFFDATSNGVSGGKYLYLEVATGSVIDTAYFVSPVIDVSNLTSPTLRFSYHMYGAHIGSLSVQIDDGSGWVGAWSLSGQQHASGSSPWKDATIDLSAFGSLLKVRFVGVRGAGFRGDIAIDDILINNNPSVFNSPIQVGSILHSGNQGWNKQFGTDVILSHDGTRMLVSNVNDGWDGYQTWFAHVVQVYLANGTSWVKMGNSIVSGYQINNGERCSFDLSGDGLRLSMGDPVYNNVRVYEYINGDWVQMGLDISGSPVDNSFGYKCSLSYNGQRLAVSISSDNTGSYIGKVRIYEWNGLGWFQIGNDILGEAIGDHFGESISFADDGESIAIGGPYNDGNGSFSGHTRVYEWNGSDWIQKGSDIDGEYPGDNSGIVVKLSGDGNRLAIGATKNDGAGTSSGHVRIFEWSSGNWSQVGNDFDGRNAYDNFGSSIALSYSGNVVSIGAPGCIMNGYNSGQVISYTWSGNSWHEYVAFGDQPYDKFGSCVTMDQWGLKMAVSAPYSDYNGNDRGKVEVYHIPQLVQSNNPDSAYVNDRNCVVCDQYAVGDTFSLDSGANWYTVVDRALLEQKRDAGDDLSKVCVSLVTDMSNLFQAKTAFNDNISGWDVSNVTDMEYMFLDAQAFNDTIGNWDVSNVNNMAFMFKGAHAFDQNLNQWDVSAVSNMRQLFFGASSFNSPIDLWDVSSVINMQGMFQGAAAFNQPIGAWEVGSVTNMNSMFYNTYAFDQDLSGWCVSNISSLPTNFAGNSALQSIHYPQWGSCPCSIVLDLGPDTVAVCGSSYTLDAGDGYSSYAWSTGATTRFITVSSSGLYSCTVSNSLCAVSDSLFVNLLDVSITASDNVVCSGDSVRLFVGGGMGTASGGSLPASLPINGLVAWYPFNGNAIDESGNGNNGTVYGATLTADRFGAFNGAYNFDGNDWIEIATSNQINFSLTDEYSISTWINLNDNSSVGSIIEKWDGTGTGYPYALRIDGNIVTVGRYNGVDGVGQLVSAQDNLSIGNFHHIVAIFGPNSIEIYIDGQSSAIFQGSYTGSIQTNSNLFIGRRGNHSSRFVNAKIDDIAIYNRTLSPSEIQILYNSYSINHTYSWSTGHNTASITANPTQTTTYYCTVSDGISSCTDSVTVYVSPLPALDLGSDTVAICGSSYTLDAGAGFDSYLWNTGDTTQSIVVSSSGLYYCTVAKATCAITDSIYINLLDIAVVASSNSICAGQEISLSILNIGSVSNQPPSIIGFDYQADYGNTHVYTSQGVMSWHQALALTQSLGGSMAIIRDANENAFFNGLITSLPNSNWWLGATDELNEGTWVWVDGSPMGYSNWHVGEPNNATGTQHYLQMYQGGTWDDYYASSTNFSFRTFLVVPHQQEFDFLWSTGDTTATITTNPTQTTTYYCTVSDGISTCTDSLTVYVNPLPTLDLGPDTIAVCGNSLILDAGLGFDQYVWSTGDSGQTISVSASGLYSCTGTSAGCAVTDSVFISLLESTIASSDSVVCAGESVMLSVGNGARSASSGNLPSYVPANGLFAWYPFNGNGDDESGNGHHLTEVATQFGTNRFGMQGQALDSGYCHLSNFLSNQTEFSVNIWVKTDAIVSASNATAIVHSPNNWQEGPQWKLFNKDNGDGLTYRMWSPSTSWQDIYYGDPDSQRWYMLTAVFENGTQSLYIDGSLIATRNSTIDNSANYYGLIIGATKETSSGAFGEFWDGKLDDVGYWSRALSSSEILALYRANPSNLTFTWSTGDTTASITANPSQTTTYYCTVSDGISTCIDSVTVYVSPLPALDLGLDTVAVCGSSYTLDAGAGFDQYQWNTGDTSQTIVVNQSGSYTVTATINESCSAFDSVYVHLLNIPIEASSSAICAGSSVELAARYVAGAIAPAPVMPGFTYHGIYKEQYIYASNSATSWPSARQACLSRGGDLIVIHDAGENTDYYAMASQYFGNLGSWIGLTDEAQEGVWTWVDGSLLGYSNWASGEPNNFGGNEDYANFTTSGQWNDRGSRSLYYLMAIPVQVASYAWSTGDSIPAISVSPTQTTTYYCTVSDGISTCTDSVTIQVTPVPAFDLGTDTLALCGTRTTLDAGSGFDSYLWSTGDTTQSIVVEASGNYSCMVTLQSCTLTDSIQVILQGVEINAFLSTITTWRQMGMDIDGELAGDRFGVNVSLSTDGSRLAAGAHFNDGNGNFSGHTRVFNWDGANWVQMGSDIDGEAAGDRSGVSVSLSANGNRLAIGAYQNDGNGSNAGQTRIFEWNGSSWNQLGADIDGEAANDWAGWSVSLSGDGTRVAIGAYQNDGNGADAGHARVYEWDGSQWFPMGLDLDGEAAGDGAGASVALSSDGSRLAVGAYKDDDGGLDAGSVQVYQWDGSSWLPLGGRLHGEGAEDYFGWSTDLSANGQRLAVGAYQNDGNGSNAGHTRVFEWDGSAWQQVGNDIDGEAAGDLSGISVALTNDGQSVAVGAHQNDGSATNAGHARLYRWDGSQWNTVSTDIDGEAAGDLSGHSIAIAADGLRLASGARVNAGSGLAAGHVRVYSLDTYWDPFSGTPRNQLVCSGDSIALEAMTDAIAGTRFLWSTGDTTSSITIAPNQSGTYSCLVSNGSFSCVDSIRVDIASPSLDLGPDTVIICGSSYTLDAGPGLETYQWSTGGANQILTVSRSGWYSCTVTQSGCAVRDSIYLHLLNASITASSACVSLGDSVSVSAISTSGLPLRYLWSTGDTTQTIWVTPTQQTALSCVVSDGITNCTASTTIQLGDWQPQATLLDNSYTTRFTWPTRNTARYNLHLREIGQSSWTNYVQTGLTKNLRNLEPGEYEFYVTAYNSIISGVDTSCMGYFTQECADISYSYNAFQAPELGRLGRVRVFGTQGGKRLYDIHLVNQEGDSTSVYNARQSNFTQLKDGRYTIYVQDDLGCSSDSIARFVIDPIDTTRVPYLIGAPNNPPNGFRPTWNSVDGIINYQLRVLNVTDGTLQDFVTGITDTNYAITNLPTGKLYRFNVRSRYNKGISVVNSGYSNPVSRNLPLTGNKGGHSSPTTLVEHGAQWLVYPNPTDGKLYVQAPLGSQLVLVDMNGKRLAESTVVATEEMLDLSVLAQGVYLLQIIHQDQVHQERIVKQ